LLSVWLFLVKALEMLRAGPSRPRILEVPTLVPPSFLQHTGIGSLPFYLRFNVTVRLRFNVQLEGSLQLRLVLLVHSGSHCSGSLSASAAVAQHSSQAGTVTGNLKLKCHWHCTAVFNFELCGEVDATGS
jgi:hypothetical protein